MIVEDLSTRKCVPCEGKEKPFSKEEALEWARLVDGRWVLDNNGTSISREFVFTDFKSAMGFVNSVANIAEEEGHHPDIHIHYNKVRLELWTHAIKGLFENDFILAAKIDKIKI